MFVIQQVGIQTTGSMNVILSLVIGALIGEMIDIDHLFEKFGNWLKLKTKSQGDHQFVNAFVTASLTVCIGAMAIMGAIQDGIYANPSILFAKAVLDFVIILAMSSSMGKVALLLYSCCFLQGTLTALSVGLAPFMTTITFESFRYGGKYFDFLCRHQLDMASYNQSLRICYQL